MKKLRHHKRIYVILAIMAVTLIIYMISGVKDRNEVELVTAEVDTGSVRQLVSVSGVAEAEQIADLGFSTPGIIRNVSVKIGDVVKEGDIIAELDTKALYADRQDALSSIQRAVADRDELISGPTDSARDLTSETIASKKENLSQTKLNEEQKIKNAYLNLLSSGLAAYSNNGSEDAIPPTISGTYSCLEEGEYFLDVFSSGSNSGYSFKLSGLERGTYEASTDQPTDLGSCGLQIIFDDNSTYSNSEWYIEIPNTKSSSYIINRNAHALAVTQAKSNISQAEQALSLAEATGNNQNSDARSEAIIRANAAIAQAQAKLNRIDANISDRVLRAPFSGTITDISIIPGETATTEPIVTLLASDDFEITARIPEIDIGKLAVGQKVEMVFDARGEEIIYGEIGFISLKETEIDGVAYYEAIIQFDSIPDWIRSGLNADIDVITNQTTDTIRIPTRFLSKDNGENTVLVLDEVSNTVSTSTIEILMQGNDGYTAVTGLNKGEVIVAP